MYALKDFIVLFVRLRILHIAFVTGKVGGSRQQCRHRRHQDHRHGRRRHRHPDYDQEYHSHHEKYAGF